MIYRVFQMTPNQIAEDAIGLFLECLSNIEGSGFTDLDGDAIEQARARALIEVSEGTAGMTINEPSECTADTRCIHGDCQAPATVWRGPNPYCETHAKGRP